MTVTLGARNGEQRQRRNASESGSRRENETNKSGAKRSLRGQPKHCAKRQMNVTLFPLGCIVNGEHAVQVDSTAGGAFLDAENASIEVYCSKEGWVNSGSLRVIPSVSFITLPKSVDATVSVNNRNTLSALIGLTVENLRIK